MKFLFKLFSLLFLLALAGPMAAQTISPIMTESGEPLDQQKDSKVINDVVEKRLTMTKRVLPYDHIREADIFWEKWVWRVIDIREKMNLPFAFPKRPFITILMDAAQAGEIQVFKDEDFELPYDTAEIKNVGVKVDTVATFDPVTYERVVNVVRNDFDPESVKRFRVKEVWFFDEETSTMQVRILGIAPVSEVTVEGESVGEQAMFWVYYPTAREALARERVFSYGNNANPMSWEDIMEMRFFASYIYKEANEFDRRLQDYLSGVDLLLEADQIKQAIFNFEHDLWSY